MNVTIRKKYFNTFVQMLNNNIHITTSFQIVPSATITTITTR